ncbi:MAG: helix-turn-helix domain-containing protein [Candidatus Delongbacteria bacterium]|nr:helix-turn-helix domain-containing protein [Candidatus Delongbacteria bacterium]
MKKQRSYSVDFKNEVIGYAQLHNIITAAEHYKLGRNTVANWIKRYKNQGLEGLVRKKKQDNQKKKLDEKLVNIIWEFKQDNPKKSLKNIKKEFNLDCSLALISRKLKRIRYEKNKRDISKFNPVQSFSVYINVLSKVNIEGQIHSVYQINIEDNISHNKFIGYSLEKNSMNISIFIDYVLSSLKNKGLINSNYAIQSNIPNLKRNEIYDTNIKRFVTSKHDTNLTINKDLNTSKSNIEIGSDLFSHKHLIKSIYKELVLGNNKVDSAGGIYAENIIIPPIFVDNFIQDIDKIVRFTDFWQTVSIPSNQNKLLLETLEEIEAYGDRAQINFDFENAINIYHKILVTCNNLNDSDELRTKVNIKQADLYYYIENYDVAEKLLTENIKLSSKRSYLMELGDSFHIMGMIKLSESDMISAVLFFNYAMKAYSKSKAVKGIYKLYSSEIYKHIALTEFNSGLVVADNYILKAKSEGNDRELALGYGLKSILFYYLNKYEESEKASLIVNKLANKIGEKKLEAKSTADLLNIYTFAMKKNPRTIKLLITRLEELSVELKKPRYLSDSCRILGMYYYKNSKYELSNEYFSKSITSIPVNKWKKYYPVEYIVNLHYLGNIHYLRKEYKKSLKYFHEARIECEKKEIKFYLTYLENSIAKSLASMGSYDKAVYYFNRAIKNSKDQKLEVISANAKMYLGEIYIEKGKIKKASKYLKNSLEEYTNIKKDQNNVHVGGYIEKIKGLLSQFEMIQK